MENRNLIEMVIQGVINQCYEYFQYDRDEVKVNFTLSSNMANDCERLRPNENIIDRKSVNTMNGLMLLPKHIDETFDIIINADSIIKYTLDNSMTWVNTIAHELTHVYDYQNLINKEELNEINGELFWLKYKTFYYWSEFHAKREGYRFLYHWLKAADAFKSDDEHIKHIVEIELVPKLADLLITLSGLNNNDRVYELMHFLGRYSVWNDLYPREFTSDKLKLAIPLREINNIYDILYQYKDFEQIYDKLGLIETFIQTL